MTKEKFNVKRPENRSEKSEEDKYLDLDSSDRETLRYVEHYAKIIENCDEKIRLNSLGEEVKERPFIDRGVAMYRLERFEEALENFQEAIKLNPTSEVAIMCRDRVNRMLEQSDN